MNTRTFRPVVRILGGSILAAAALASARAQNFSVVNLPQNNLDAPISLFGNVVNNGGSGGGVVFNPPGGAVDVNTFTPVDVPPLNLGSFTINIVPGAGLSSNAAALAAFNRAAAAWASLISDPITITINADLAALGAGIIGSTSSVTLQAGYNTIRNQLVLDAAVDGDTISASLPTAAQFSALVPAGVSLNGTVTGTKASLKAMGFGGLDGSFGVSDASITFSTNFSFDYDRSNGFTPGTVDFETVAQHEIGHALGFTSVVDQINGGATSVGPTTLDLYRFTRNVAGQDPATAADFTNFPRNYIPGADTAFDDITNAYRMAAGLTNASFPGTDGTQASHWKADEQTGQYIGIMDPTLANETAELATAADFRAFDLIGYDIVPEPTAFAALLAGGLGLVGLRRRRE